MGFGHCSLRLAYWGLLFACCSEPSGLSSLTALSPLGLAMFVAISPWGLSSIIAFGLIFACQYKPRAFSQRSSPKGHWACYCLFALSSLGLVSLLIASSPLGLSLLVYVHRHKPMGVLSSLIAFELDIAG